MRAALSPARVEALYDRSAWRYDLYHGLATARADQRGRRLVVAWGVREGDHVLDAGGGTGSTALLAARRVGEQGHVTVLDQSDGMMRNGRARAHAVGLCRWGAGRWTCCRRRKARARRSCAPARWGCRCGPSSSSWWRSRPCRPRRRPAT